MALRRGRSDHRNHRNSIAECGAASEGDRVGIVAGGPRVRVALFPIFPRRGRHRSRRADLRSRRADRRTRLAISAVCQRCRHAAVVALAERNSALADQTVAGTLGMCDGVTVALLWRYCGTVVVW